MPIIQVCNLGSDPRKDFVLIGIEHKEIKVYGRESRRLQIVLL